MNILEHDSDGKFYHEYKSSITRGGSTDDTTSNNSSASVVTGFNGPQSQQQEQQYSDETSTILYISNIGSSDNGLETKSKSSNCSSNNSSSNPDGGLLGGGMDIGTTSNSVDGLDISTIKVEEDSAAIFTCENCGKAAYKNGEFETIKLGDIFTHLTQFPSSEEGAHAGPRLCAQCLNSSHLHTRGSTAHHNLHLNNTSSVINSSSSSGNSITNTVVVTNTSGDDGSPSSNRSDCKIPASINHGEGSGQLLQGVSTIIMQNSNHPSLLQHQQQHQHNIHQLQTHFQQTHPHDLQSPPPPPQDMHHDHQNPHNFYQQGHLLQPEMRGVKLEPDSMAHSQPQHLDNFMLIHDSAMYSDNNESLQQQQQLHETIISFHQQQAPETHLQHQQRQVICDNQQHQPAIQQITVVTPGSDIKYSIPTAVMQMQGKDQVEVDQGQSQQHLIQFSGQNPLIPQHSDGGGDGNGSGGGVGVSNTFQFLDSLEGVKNPAVATDLKAHFSSGVLTTAPTSSVVTHTVTTSSITSSTTTNSTSKPNAKSRSKNNNSTASGSAGASKSSGAGENPKIPCDLCKKKFKNPKMAMNHYKRVHQKEARFVCEICGAVFSYRGSLDSHLASHKPPEKTHDCEKCGMKFSVKANLRQHMRIHSDNPKKFPCDFCPSGFSKRVNLRYHIKRKHPEEAEKMNNNNNSKDSGAGNPQAGLAGTITGTTTTTNAANNPGGDDASKDKNQGSFKCEHCERAFLFKNNLKAHLRTHTRDKKYTCELCAKSFIYKESLKNHMLLHSNELPYLCDICGKKFRDRSNRRKHVKNVHKYLFVNGDINNPLKPGATAPGSSASGAAATQGATTTPASGEPPTKKRKNSKKAAQQQTAEQSGQENNSNKTRTIIKSPAAPRGKKAKNSAAAATSTPKAASNTKSVIVSASTTGSLDTKLDRKIIMSPNPKSSGNVGSPNSMEYVHSHSSLPVTVHVPLAGSQGQFSHGRNIIVKASPSSTATAIPPNHQSPPALSPEMYHHSQHQHSRVPASMQQNVIVYPKPKVIPDQYPSSSSVISQTMQQAQHQYYVNPEQHHHHQPPPQQQQGYGYLQLTSQSTPSPVQSSLMPPSHISSPNPNAFDYVLSTNLSSSQDNRGNGSSGAAHPYGGGSTASGSHPPMEIQVVNAEYAHLYSTDPNSLAYEQHHQQHPQYHWSSAHPPPPPPGLDHGPHPPNSSSPYQLVAPPAGSNGSSSGLVNEGPGSHPHGPPVSLAQSYESNALNASSAVYATGAPQGHEVLDPSGNGGNFFYKDFDFSYL